VLIDHNTVFQTGPITWVYDTTNNIAITNNLFNCFLSDGGYQGIYGPGFAQGGNGPMGKYFPGITDANRRFHKNVLIGGNSLKYSNYNTQSQNYFPASTANVNFVAFANGGSDYHNYALNAASIYKNAATDGRDIGVDVVQLDTALIRKVTCKTTVTTQEAPLEIHLRIQPNPVHDHAVLVSSIDLNDAVLTLNNSLGQEVKRFPHLNGRAVDLTMKDLPAGLYVATMWQGKGVIATERLVLVSTSQN
jgi:hypothetical protein